MKRQLLNAWNEKLQLVRINTSQQYNKKFKNNIKGELNTWKFKQNEAKSKRETNSLQEMENKNK